MKLVKDIANPVLRYIGMEVHQDSTTAAVRDAQGNLLMEVTLLRAEGRVLADFLRGLRGTKARRAGCAVRARKFPFAVRGAARYGFTFIDVIYI